ncbi:sensor domain-containing protein [Tahibacter amnicola]|uniref:Diguanylate cyclase n=1 Tax=Tahibacter amnicola TaxID=2976241 RepID=A0ABY6BHJ7_9GAMM|nr:PAS domain S-box protein [Tahibacter amnicola]UXI69061.1 diguanylate cyclase [Tahibacter amnicola]
MRKPGRGEVSDVSAAPRLAVLAADENGAPLLVERLQACGFARPAICRLGDLVSAGGPSVDVLVLGMAELHGSVAVIDTVVAHAPETLCLVAVDVRDDAQARLVLARGIDECVRTDEKDVDLIRHVHFALARRQGRARTAYPRTSLALAAFDESVTLLCVHDMDGRLLAVNDAAATALGYRVDQVEGLSLAKNLGPAMSRRFPGYLKRLRANGLDTGVFALRHRDGRLRYWKYANCSVSLPDGREVVVGNAHDVTAERLERRSEEARLAELEAVNDAALIGLFRADIKGDVTYVNTAYERLSGLYTRSALGSGWLDAVHADDRVAVKRAWQDSVAARGRFFRQFRFQQADGRVLWVDVQAAPVVVDGEIAGFAGSVEDVTARQHAEQSLRRSEQRLRTITNALPAMVAYVDAGWRFVFANARYEATFAQGRSVVGRQVIDVLSPDQFERRRANIERALQGERIVFEDEHAQDEERRVFEFSYIPQLDEDEREVIGVHSMVQDVTPQKREEQRLLHLAEQDPLTGLLNRAGFMARLTRALARTRDQKTQAALMYLDVDYFKKVNDTLGHGIGDALLKAFAQRLTDALRTSDAVGRLGGDEFVVVSENVRRREYAAAVAAKIVTAMRRPFLLDGQTVRVSTSVGLAFSDGTQSTSALLELADQALYRAKQAGRDTYRVSE